MSIRVMRRLAQAALGGVLAIGATNFAHACDVGETCTTSSETSNFHITKSASGAHVGVERSSTTTTYRNSTAGGSSASAKARENSQESSARSPSSRGDSTSTGGSSGSTSSGIAVLGRHYDSVSDLVAKVGQVSASQQLGLQMGLDAGVSGVSNGSATAGAGAAAPPAMTAAQLAAVVRTVSQQAAASIQVPVPGVELGPDPSLNEWKMFAVGQPVWIWSDQTSTVDGSTTQQGIPITLVAHRLSTTVSTGDGTTLTCTTMTARPNHAAPTAASPDCGHTWMTHGNYTVTATTSWQVDWSALGQSGSLTIQRSSSRTVKVGQLASLVVR